MAKNTRSYDDEIDLTQLIQLFLNHKGKYLLLGLLGLVLGLGYTYQHEPRYQTNFKVSVGHPTFSSRLISESDIVLDLLYTSELNPSSIPHISYDQKTKQYKVITDEMNASDIILPIITEALHDELKQLKQVAGNFKAVNDKPVIINATGNKNFSNIITWSNEDIAMLDSNEVIETLGVSFGMSKSLYPQPIMHGLIGIMIGFVFAFGWMISGILVSELSRQKK